jgi:glycosyltransferase involved in cell wall biosynthesis
VLADITPVILTYNESANIGRSLERLTWAREVVIVDSGSTDDTLAIAARFPNMRVVHRPFDSHSRQWKFATSETGVTSGWILRLDADYMMEPALRDEIAALVPDQATAAYRIAFTYCMEGKPLRASLYPAQPVLFRRGREAFVQDGHTEKLRIDGVVVPLNNRLLHDDRKSIERWLQSQSRYQAAEAEKLATRPWSELSWPDRLRCTRVLGPVAVAVHCLFIKGLVFDGSAGLFYTAQRVTADMILSMHLLRRDLGK